MKKPSPSPLHAAKLRQRAHDLKAKGCRTTDIQKELDVSRSTLADWFGRPRPTDEEVAHLEKLAREGDTVSVRMYLDATTAGRLFDEAARQGVPRTRIVELALRLYCDAMDTTRGLREGNLDVWGYRV